MNPPKTEAPVTAALEELLQRFLPGQVSPDAIAARVSVRTTSVEVPVVVIGVGRRLLQIGHPGRTVDAFVPQTRLVLSVVLGDGALRIDLPVEVVACGRASMLLRVLASPLVLRRRMVRDQALEEALGVQPHDHATPQPLVA